MLRHAIAIAAFAATATPAVADPTYITLEVQDALSTVPNGINSAGDVAGEYVDQNRLTHGFVRLHDGAMQTFDIGGAHSGIHVIKINDNGEVAGYFYAHGHPRGFLRSANGSVKLFDVSGAISTYVAGLNNTGAVTGYGVADSGNTYHGFARKPGGGKIAIDVPDATRTQPGAINDLGAVAGVYYTGNFPYYAFVRDRKGAITTFNAVDSFFNVVAINNAGTIAGNTLFEGGFVLPPDGKIEIFKVGNHLSVVQGMNGDGAVTGWFEPADNKAHGFLRTPDGKRTVFDYPGIKAATYPAAINDSGVIIGKYVIGDQVFGFVRTP